MQLPRSTKAGVETPATPGGRRRTALRASRSTKAGVETPATHVPEKRDRAPPRLAQRRLGSKPQRHLRCGARSRRTLRSLNEGWGRNPSDTFNNTGQNGHFKCAQRRLGSKPQRHYRPSTSETSSMRVAQRRLGSKPQRHTNGPTAAARSSASLNEGWGRNPSDTRALNSSASSCRFRSTKAGVETPATPLRPRGWKPVSPNLRTEHE